VALNDIYVITVNRGPAGPPGPAGSGDILADDGITVVEAGGDVTIGADFGAGVGKVLEAVQDAIEAVLAVALAQDGPVFALAGELLSRPIAPTDLGATATTGHVLTRTGAGAMDWQPAAGGDPTKEELEAILNLDTGFVRAAADALTASALVATDLAASPVDTYFLKYSGTAMAWVAPVIVDVSAAGVVTGLSSGAVIPVTTGFSFGGTLPATGFFRLPHASTVAVGKSQSGLVDYNLITYGVSTNNRIDIGSSVAGFVGVLVAAGNTASFIFAGAGMTASGSTTHTFNVNSIAKVTIAATGITLGTTSANANDITWGTGATAPTLSQSTKTADAAPANMSISPQAPFATATGANRVPGGLTCTIGSPTNGGTTHGAFTVAVAASNVLVVDKDASGNGRVAVAVASTTSAPAAGGAGALPATPAGYMTITVNGVARQIPYY
jgi:hypothetical protein